MSMDINSVQTTVPDRTAQYNREKITIKVPSGSQPDQSSVIVDPSMEKKLQASKSSINDELNLMKNEQQRRDKNQEVLNQLKEQLMQLELMLQSAVASISGDPTSLENARDRIAGELGSNAGKIKFVDLPELDLALSDIDTENLSLSNTSEAEKVRYALNSAVQAVDKAITENGDNVRQTQTEKTLQVAHQNADAVLSTSDPRNIFGSSDKAAELLRDIDLGAEVHSKLTAGVVIDLLS